MRNYDDFSYKPDYGFTLIKGEKTICSEEHVIGAVCFSKVFRLIDPYPQSEYTGIYTLKCRKQFKAYSGNFCAMDKKQISHVLRYIRRTLDVKVSFRETNTDYCFVFTVVGKPIKHKFLLTFSRVFFEFPYNEFARDVFLVRESGLNNKNVKHKSFLELFHLCQMSCRCWGGGHSLFSYPCLDLNTQILHNAYKTGLRSVQEVYQGTSWEVQDKMRTYSSYNHNWEEGFNIRLQRYSANFEILKNLKKQNEKNIRRRKRA